MNFIALVLVVCSAVLSWVMLTVPFSQIAFQPSDRTAVEVVASAEVGPAIAPAVLTSQSTTDHVGCDCAACRQLASQLLQGKLPQVLDA
ncbi:hypothetical protein H6F43_01455 [Leptolyngbya sp. FACHB-36]|uniref:hypothetical protein n=1 Tax=Leptolyngbya sp. FACHB-36 TaxID=2692808 RepID=UPI001680D2BA|nr:hypothetical protein [Leptolyngbya sp. FACHB-36]MBD2018851.1 hypothetical protein [Leptolyngbya sp. FACHB-36]